MDSQNKKYDFTGEIKEVAGIALHKIRALKDFGNVRKGDLGGWIENKENLAQDGDAQVCGDARVYGGIWEKSPCLIQGTRWSINISSPDTIQCGCQNHTWKEWNEKYLKISREHGADDVLDEYVRYFNLLCEMYGHDDCRIERETVHGT